MSLQLALEKTICKSCNKIFWQSKYRKEKLTKCRRCEKREMSGDKSNKEKRPQKKKINNLKEKTILWTIIIALVILTIRSQYVSMFMAIMGIMIHKFINKRYRDDVQRQYGEKAKKIDAKLK
jgi:hypothetical protein